MGCTENGRSSLTGHINKTHIPHLLEREVIVAIPKSRPEMSLNNPFLSDVDGVDPDDAEPLVAAPGTHRYVTRDPKLPDGVGGEQQSKGLTGFPIAIIFYIHLIAVITVALGWGLPAVTDVKNDSDTEYHGIANMALIIGSVALLLSGVVLFILSSMTKCVSFMMKFCLFLSTSVLLVIGVAGASSGNAVLSICGFSGFLLMLCFVSSVWRKIPLATANLATAAGAIQSNFGLFAIGILFTLGTFAWVIIWVLAVIGKKCAFTGMICCADVLVSWNTA